MTTRKHLALVAALAAVLAGAAFAEMPPANLHVSNTAPVPALHTMDRAAVAAHRRAYVPTSEGVQAHWVGDVANCVAGDVCAADSAAHSTLGGELAHNGSAIGMDVKVPLTPSPLRTNIWYIVVR